jgi:hypothetical protein
MKIRQIKMHHYMTDLLGGIEKDGQVSGSLQKCKGRKGESSGWKIEYSVQIDPVCDCAHFCAHSTSK